MSIGRLHSSGNILMIEFSRCAFCPCIYKLRLTGQSGRCINTVYSGSLHVFATSNMLPLDSGAHDTDAPPSNTSRSRQYDTFNISLLPSFSDITHAIALSSSNLLFVSSNTPCTPSFAYPPSPKTLKKAPAALLIMGLHS